MMLECRFLGRAVASLLLAGLGACGDDNNPAGPNGLTLRCSATPTAGPPPLAVAFAVAISGAKRNTAVAVNYGDGTTGNDPNASHIYSSAGSYTAGFNVQADGQATSCNVGINVSAAPKPPGVTGNQPPNAVFKTDPVAGANGRIEGTTPLEVHFNMCPTSDAERDPLLFTFDFDGDGKVDTAGSTGANCRQAVLFYNGTFRARACVTDLTALGGDPIHPAQCQTYDVRAN